jgi:hypothetical protein
LKDAHRGGLDIGFAHDAREEFVESEIEAHLALEVVSRAPQLVGYVGNQLDEAFDFLYQMRDEPVKHRDDDGQEHEVDNRNQDGEFVESDQKLADFRRLETRRELGNFYFQPLCQIQKKVREEESEQENQEK